MSWEEMGSETKPCPCGKGTVTYRWEMDDWNRTRGSTTIDCPKCKAEADAREAAAMQREREREELLSKARRLGEERYLERWLALFKNKNKKEAWLIYTGGDGYPALGTFYTHVRDEGIEKYLTQHFSYDLDKVLRKLRVDDQEITALLKAAEKLRLRRVD